MVEGTFERYLLGVEAITLLLAAGNWWRVWDCPCELTLKGAAFWTALSISQAVVIFSLSVLRAK
jgi:hypothetical protein